MSVGGRGSAGASGDEGTARDVVRSEEELAVTTERQEAGRVRARKVVDRESVEELVPVGTEHAEVERAGPVAGDSGEVETLPDGSISIPVFEEQLVIEKRLVVRERIIIRKHTVSEDRVVTADLRRERVEVDVDDAVADRLAVDDRLSADDARP